jgi:MFS superfamily sulfate permease-like transporter
MITKFFPFLTWFKGYKAADFKLDLVAGVTVALVLIPQSMAYAQLAGLPAYYGLYAAFLPPMLASLFGSSRQLATGPVAVVSLMSAASLEPLATAGSSEFIAYSIILAMVVGIFQLSLGVLRLGLVVNFLSHPVVNGFSNAAAIIIASSQFSKFFGVDVDKAAHHYETLIRVAKSAFDYTHIPTLMYGVGAVVIMVVLRRINPRIPNVLIAVLITTLISFVTGFNKDAYVDISAIQMPGLKEKMQKYNQAVGQIKGHGEVRADLGKALDELKKAEKGSHIKSEELIKAERDVEIMSSRMDQAKEEASKLRYELRHMKFEAVKKGEDFIFYPKNVIPDGLENDGNIWRIKVTVKPLNTSSLKMVGGGAIVGKIPEGLPKFTIPELNLNSFLKLLPTAIIISLLGFMEAIAIAKAMAAKTGQKLDHIPDGNGLCPGI